MNMSKSQLVEFFNQMDFLNTAVEKYLRGYLTEFSFDDVYFNISALSNDGLDVEVGVHEPYEQDRVFYLNIKLTDLNLNLSE